MNMDHNKTLRETIAQEVKAYMDGDQFDASHDWSHIQRVLETSLSIAAAEKKRPNCPHFNDDIIYLAALMHDLTDHKYVDTSNIENKIRDMLESSGADRSLAAAVQTVCQNVSYSNEMKSPDAVLEVLKRYPELGVVQDADRLDAIGAVGIARTFAYTGAVSSRGKKRTLDGTIDHFHEKLERIANHMKTEEGKRRARERTRRLEQFRGWFAEETDVNV